MIDAASAGFSSHLGKSKCFTACYRPADKSFLAKPITDGIHWGTDGAYSTTFIVADKALSLATRRRLWD